MFSKVLRGDLVYCMDVQLSPAATRVLRLRGEGQTCLVALGLAREVNTVFNYCNELSVKVFERETALFVVDSISGRSSKGSRAVTAPCICRFKRYRRLPKNTRDDAGNIEKSDWPGAGAAAPAGPLAGFPSRSERFVIEGDRSTSRDVGLSLWDSYGLGRRRTACGQFQRRQPRTLVSQCLCASRAAGDERNKPSVRSILDRSVPSLGIDLG